MTVLVSVFNFLLTVTRQHFTKTSSDGLAILQKFPVKDLFVHVLPLCLSHRIGPCVSSGGGRRWASQS